MITIPLRDIPGYTPDGPVWISVADFGPCVLIGIRDDHALDVLTVHGAAAADRDGADLILDATGAASLARAVAASRGLNPGRGLQWWIDDADRSLGMHGDVTAWFVPCAGIAAFETVVPALADINPDDPSAPLLALAAVARVVLGAQEVKP